MSASYWVEFRNCWALGMGVGVQHPIRAVRLLFSLLELWSPPESRSPRTSETPPKNPMGEIRDGGAYKTDRMLDSGCETVNLCYKRS